jgi:hypothetical protein
LQDTQNVRAAIAGHSSMLPWWVQTFAEEKQSESSEIPAALIFET